MIVTRKEAERKLGRPLRGPDYVGKRWFLLSRSIPHRNLGGFPTKAQAEQHEREVQYFKRNPSSSTAIEAKRQGAHQKENPGISWQRIDKLAKWQGISRINMRVHIGKESKRIGLSREAITESLESIKAAEEAEKKEDIRTGRRSKRLSDITELQSDVLLRFFETRDRVRGVKWVKDSDIIGYSKASSGRKSLMRRALRELAKKGFLEGHEEVESDFGPGEFRSWGRVHRPTTREACIYRATKMGEYWMKGRHINPGNPIPSRMPAGAAARKVWKTFRDHKTVSSKRLAAETGMNEYDVEAGLRWLEHHGYARVREGKYKPLRHAFAVVNPSENPRPFGAREHDWSEVLIARKGKRLTRKQIRDYYKRVQKKIWPFLKGQTVMVIFAPAKNVFVRRRNGPNDKHIKLTKLEGIDDPRSYEYWINRRVVEFHPVLTTKSSSLLWLDLDMHKSRGKKRIELLAKMKHSVPKLKKAFAKMGVKKVYVYDSGTGGGIHLEGMLPKSRNVDVLRREFRKVLDETFEGDDAFTTGMDKAGQIRLDTTTFHRLGSLRAPYSMTVNGGVKRRIGR